MASPRTFEVEFSGTCNVTIDEDAVSEWDGAKILEVLEKRGRGKDSTGDVVYTDEATLAMLVGHLGLQLSVENRRMGNIDGWADFPEDAAKGDSYSVDWRIESVVDQNGVAL